MALAQEALRAEGRSGKTVTTRAAEFNAVMQDAKLRPIDLARLAGVDRRTVWRWRSGHSPVPDYAWTIVRLQQRVRELTAAAIE